MSISWVEQFASSSPFIDELIRRQSCEACAAADEFIQKAIEAGLLPPQGEDMSYTCRIINTDGSVTLVDYLPRGSVINLNPTYPAEAEFHITYNYGIIFKKVIRGGIGSFDGVYVKNTIKILQEAISNLKDDVSADYWEATEGNVKMALEGMLALAVQCPDGIWEIS